MPFVCFTGQRTGTEEGQQLSPVLVAHRTDYLKRKAEHARIADKLSSERARVASLPAGAASLPARAELQEMEQDEHYSQEAADTAFGALARMAHAEGLRACLCGKIEKEEAAGRRKAGTPRKAAGKGASRRAR